MPKTTRRSSGRKTARRTTAAKRTTVAPKGNKRYVRRDTKGRFKEVDDVSRSLSADRRKTSRTRAKKGQGDRGDR